MKYSFKVPTAKIDGAAIQMENKNFLVSACRSLFKACSISWDPAGQFIFNITIGKQIQGAYYDTSGNYSTDGTLATAFKIIDSTGEDEFGNLQLSDPSQYVAGVSYLIPAKNYGVLPITPMIGGIPIGNIPAYQSVAGDPALIKMTMLTDTTFPFDAPNNGVFLNVTEVTDVISFQKYGSVIETQNGLRNDRKAVELAQWATSVGAVQTAGAMVSGRPKFS